MTDISVTATAVVAGSGANVSRSEVAGATITQGQAVYKDASTSKCKLSDANGSGTKAVYGIALNAASDGQPIDVLKGGDLTLNAVLTAGLPYFLSGTAGGICPEADLVTGMQKIQIGIAKSTTVLHVSIQDSGVTV